MQILVLGAEQSGKVSRFTFAAPGVNLMSALFQSTMLKQMQPSREDVSEEERDSFRMNTASKLVQYMQ